MKYSLNPGGTGSHIRILLVPGTVMKIQAIPVPIARINPLAWEIIIRGGTRRAARTGTQARTGIRAGIGPWVKTGWGHTGNETRYLHPLFLSLHSGSSRV